MKTFNLPDPGEGLVEAEIVSWKVQPGDEVKVNDIVLEIETAKSLVELPIPWSGRVAEILVAEGTTVEVGTPIITIDDGSGPAEASRATEPVDQAEAGAGTTASQVDQPDAGAAAPSAAPGAAPAGGAAAAREFPLPDPGEGLVEAEIVSWKVQPGQEVKVNDIIVEIETAKSLVELPIPWTGRVEKLLVSEGTTVEVGTPIIAIAVEGDAPAAPVPAPAATPAAEEEDETDNVPTLVGYGAKKQSGQRRRKAAVQPPAGAPAGAAVASPAPAAPAAPAGPVNERPLAKPPVRKFAKDHGIDLAMVPPTGAGGITTREDVEKYLAGGGPAPAGTAAAGAAPAAAAAGAPATPAPAWGGAERETRIPIKGVRKVTGEAMKNSAFTAPHVTEFYTVDCTAMMDMVAELKADRAWKDVKVSPMLLLAKAVIMAVRKYPQMIAVWDDKAQEIVQKNYLNLGFAAATPRGLMVPNIKDADRLSMKELAQAFQERIEVARAGKLQPADMSGGCITITNVGVFGVDTGTPIINPGESAIVAFGSIERRPWVVGTGRDERIEPRWVTQLAVSFDHRLIDGELGSRFLHDVGTLVSDPRQALLW